MGVINKVGSFSLRSGRPEAVRFTEISAKQIVRMVESVGENVDGTKTQIKMEPSQDYFNALNLLLDFVVDAGDLGSKWTAGEVESLRIGWLWSDKTDEWLYNITVTVKKPIQPDDAIPLACYFTLPKIWNKDLAPDTIGYLNTIFDEAWLYLNGKFAEGVQGSLLDPPEYTVAEEVQGVQEDDEYDDEVIEEREPMLV